MKMTTYTREELREKSKEVYKVLGSKELHPDAVKRVQSIKKYFLMVGGDQATTDEVLGAMNVYDEDSHKDNFFDTHFEENSPEDSRMIGITYILSGEPNPHLH